MSASFPRSFVCSVCYKGRGSNAKGQPEELLQCTHCGSHSESMCMLSYLFSTVLQLISNIGWGQAAHSDTCVKLTDRVRALKNKLPDNYK